MPTESITSSELVEINGNKQFIDVRGDNAKLPVLLILHGGPGTPETAFVHYYNSKLSDYFIVVNWEQRGAGISLMMDQPTEESMTVESFISDANVVTELLKKKFGKEKIYLLGHSWGSQLGMFLIDRYPENYQAYIGTGQVAHTDKSEKMIFELVLEWARKDGNQQAIDELNSIFEPQRGGYDYTDLNKLEKHRKWATYYGGGPVKMIRMDHDNSLNPVEYLNNLIEACEPYKKYNIDIEKFYAGQSFIPERFFQEVNELNPADLVKKVNVPVYFLQGVDDAQTSYEVAKEYLESLEAPKKKFFSFKKSSHSPMFEEVDKFYEVVREIIKDNQADEALTEKVNN